MHSSVCSIRLEVLFGDQIHYMQHKSRVVQLHDVRHCFVRKRFVSRGRYFFRCTVAIEHTLIPLVQRSARRLLMQKLVYLQYITYHTSQP